MRQHMAKVIGIGVVAAVVGALCGAGLGRADAGSAHRYADAAADARTRDLEVQLADAIKERDRLRTDNEAMQAQLRDSAPAVDLGGAMTQLQDQLASARAELDSAKARADKELADAKAALAGAQQAADQQATAARQSAERESARWRQQAQEAQAQVEPLRREVADLRQQVVTLTDTIRTMKLIGGGR